MLRLLIVIIILSFSQVASAVNNMTPPPCGSDSTGSDACLGNAVNCLVGQDPGCTSGYCGYFTANSPINIPNMFGVILNDILDFGTPSEFLGSLQTVLTDGINADTSTEGAYITLKNCPTNAAGSVDWVNCPWYTYDFQGFGNKAIGVINGSPTSDPTKASPNIAKPAMYKDNKFMVDSNNQQLYCPLMRANIPTFDMSWALTYSLFPSGNGTSHQSLSLGNETNPNFPVGSWQWGLDLVKLKLDQEGDQICLKGQFPGVSSILGNWLTMACKYSPSPLLSCDKNNPGFSCAGTQPCDATTQVSCNTACYLAGSCTGNNKAAMHTLSKFTLLGNFIECFTDTLNQLFIDPPQGSGCPATGLLYYFQMKMRQVVAGFLTLYVIFLGIKIASSGEVPKKSELFMFVLKFALVIYFAVGSFSDPSDSNIYNNGLTFAYKSAFAFMNEFANNIMTAAELSEGSFCQFPPPGGRGYQDGYSYLALWDSMDCHISSYLGVYDLIHGNSKIITIMSAIFIYILGLNPIVTLFLTAFVFFMIAVMVYVANIFALCMLGMVFLVYLGPIFIPLSLFTFTKQYYDCWFKLLFSYVLQPAVVMAGFALVIVTLDSQMYKGCEFSMLPTNDAPPLYFTVFSSEQQITDPNAPTCQSSFGYFISAMQEADFGAMHSIGLITFYSPKLPSLGFLGNLMTIALLLFVFKEFVEILGSLAADVTGGMNMSSSTMATPKEIQGLLGKSLNAVQSMGRNIAAKGASAAYDKLKKRAPVVPPAAGGGGGGNPPPAPQYKGGTAKTRLDAALDFGNNGGVNPMFKPSPKGSGSGVVQKDAGAENNPFYTPPPAKPAFSGAKAAVEAAKAAAVSGVSVTPTSAQAAVDAAAAVASGTSPAAPSAPAPAAQKPKSPRRSAKDTKGMVESRRAAVTAKDAAVAKDAAAAEAATPKHRKMLKAADEAIRPSDNTTRKRVTPIKRLEE